MTSPATNRAAIYRRSYPEAPWDLGLGFDDHLARLCSAPAAPTDAADAALAAAGWVRVGPWSAHPRRDGWLVADVRETR